MADLGRRKEAWVRACSWKTKSGWSYLSDTLLVLASVERGPGDLSRVLALEEKRLALAVLEAENLRVATDVELALCNKRMSALHLHPDVLSQLNFSSFHRK